MGMNKLATILRIATALLFQTNAEAWNGAGHQVIAAAAYRQLPPNMQMKVTEIPNTALQTAAAEPAKRLLPKVGK